jgi:hypothetical protein
VTGVNDATDNGEHIAKDYVADFEGRASHASQQSARFCSAVPNLEVSYRHMHSIGDFQQSIFRDSTVTIQHCSAHMMRLVC